MICILHYPDLPDVSWTGRIPEGLGDTFKGELQGQHLGLVECLSSDADGDCLM